MRMLRRSVGAAILLAGGSAVTAQAPVPAVSVVPVPVHDVAPSSEFVGRVEAINAVDVRARVEGFIEARPFAEGQGVHEGQDLFTIEKAAGAKDRGTADLEHRPEYWSKIRVGSIVLAEDVPLEGWYESVVSEVMSDGPFRLKWQFWPSEASLVRKVGQLALQSQKVSL
jgi:hypothetical protein